MFLDRVLELIFGKRNEKNLDILQETALREGLRGKGAGFVSEKSIRDRLMIAYSITRGVKHDPHPARFLLLVMWKDTTFVSRGLSATTPTSGHRGQENTSDSSALLYS